MCVRVRMSEFVRQTAALKFSRDLFKLKESGVRSATMALRKCMWNLV